MMARPIRNMQEICADCGAYDSTWASVNRGILICDECCCLHRTLGRQTSQVKSLSKSVWVESQLQMVRDLYNNGSNSIWEHTLLDPLTGKSAPHRKKPSAKDPIHPNKSDFIRAKHQQLAFINKSTRKEESEADISEQLHSSVRTPNLKTSLRLLAAGANPNYIHNEKYNSPLHMAARAGQLSQIELLMVYGADPVCVDARGKTPIDYAKDAGHSEIAERLIECQYELSDRLTRYLSGRSPDHKSGQHFLIAEIIVDANEQTSEQTSPEARIKLHDLSEKLFAELCRDVYDEVDRREVDVIMAQNNQPNDRQSIPFLPVDHQFSAIRNQGRQKLARLNSRELASLIVDILSEIRRRVHGISFTRSKSASSQEQKIDKKLQDEKIVQGVLLCDDSDCDSEPVYDSVPSEDEEFTDNHPQNASINHYNKANNSKSSVPLANSNDIKKESSQTKRTTAKSSSCASSASPSASVSIEQYCTLQGQLTRSDTLIQELVHSNKDMRHEISRLQIMVQKLIDENGQLRAVVMPEYAISRDDHVNAQSNNSQQINNAEQSPPPAIMPRSSGKSQNRPQSMYERPSPHTQACPSSNSMASLNTIASSSHAQSNTHPDSIKTISKLNVPTKDQVLRKTDQIRNTIQELLAIAQEGKHSCIESCTEKISIAVTDMIAIFPESFIEMSSIPNGDQIFLALRQLHQSALHLQMDCRSSNLAISLQQTQTTINTTASTEHNNQDFRVLYQQVIQSAYDIAKAAKQLVTLFH